MIRRGFLPAGAALAVLVAPVLALEIPAGIQPLSKTAITSAATYSRNRGGQALIIRQAGRTVHEEYSGGGAIDRAHWILSITKNLWALAAFAAEADGILELDEPVAATIREWKNDPLKPGITVRELLCQTSGLHTGFDRLYDREIENKTAAALRLPCVHRAGEAFDYGPAHFEVFGEVLRRKLQPRGETALAYLHRRILAPVGASFADWRYDKSGTPYFSTGAKMTARDLAKVAGLIQSRGRHFLSQLLPAKSFPRDIRGTAANAMYGMSFWLNANAAAPAACEVAIEHAISDDPSPARWSAACISRHAPPDLIALVGSGGQRAYVIPSRHIEIVRFAASDNFSDSSFLNRLLR